MADRFWVGGGGSWTAINTTNWSASSGGAGGASVPTASDNAIFDAASNATGYTVTISAAACLNLTMANPASGVVTLAGTGALAISGGLTLASGMTRTYTGTITFNATSGTHTITSNSVALSSPMNFNGAGGTWQLADALSNGTSNSLHQIAILAGTFSTMDFDVTTVNFTMQGSGVKVVNWGSSTITLSLPASSSTNSIIADNVSNLTFDAGTSVLTFTNSVIINVYESGYTFYDITITTPVGFSTSKFIGGSFTCHDFTITGGSTVTTPYSDRFFFYSNQAPAAIVVSNNFTATGTQQRPLTFQGTTNVGSNTITCNGTVSLTDVNFHHVVCAGSGTWSGTRVGNAGQNSGVTFTAARNLFWIGNGGNWQDNSHWSLTTGGASATTYPLPQDVCFFDANSFSSGSQSVVVNTIVLPSMVWTGATNTPTLNINGTAGGGLDFSSLVALVGSTYTFISAMTFSGSTTWPSLETAVGGTMTITMGGHVWGSAADGWGGDYMEIGGFNTQGDVSGTFVFADNFTPVNEDDFYVQGYAAPSTTVNVGATVLANSWDFGFGGNSYVTPYAVTITINGTFALRGASGGLFLYDTPAGVSWAGTGQILFDTAQNTGDCGIAITNCGSSDCTVPIYVSNDVATTLTIASDGGVEFDRVEKQPNTTNPVLHIDNATGTAIGTLIWDGKKGTLATIASASGAATAALALTNTQAVSYLTITRIVLTGSLTAVNSTNGGSTTGVTFVTRKAETTPFYA